MLNLPNPAVWLIVALLPLGGIAVILLQRKNQPLAETKCEQAKLNIPWRFLCTAFIQGTAFGILQSILLVMEGSAEATVVSTTGSLVGAIAVFLVVFLFRLDFNQLVYHVGFVILASSFVFMAAAGSLFAGGWILNAIGYRFIDILMWALCAYLIKQRGLPTNWVFAITTGSLLIGQVFGALTGSFIRVGLADQRGGTELLSAFMVFILLTGALLMSNQNNLKKGWGMIRPGDGDDQDDDLKTLCALVTDGFEITPRECEIFVLLAQHCSRAQISEKLFLSRETVKTHTRNIYRKMGLHSQQELISLVAAQARKGNTGARAGDT
jgi:DNA-binding CsgD family transcriptional regulator